MLGKMRTGREGDDRMRWLDGITNSMDMGLGGLGVGDGQGGLVCCSSWGCKELDMTEWVNWTELTLLTVFSCPFPSELPEAPSIEEEVEETESWAKPLVHLWQTKSPNFVAEQEYNTAMGRMEPHCAICALLMPYYKVAGGRGACPHFLSLQHFLCGCKNTGESLYC